MRPLMVLGCTSGAGKSWLVTALCRWFARQGVDVVPFKAQNMSNNARVVDGGEIGVAQWLQALAAGVEPDVRMNPVLLKPEADTRSQVVIDGRVAPAVTDMPWRERGPVLWPAMTAAFDSLAAEHDLVVLEGAGSPAEINLPDLVNNRMLAHADAAALLVSDIDRGGAFAHVYGTWALVPPATRERLAGYVLNRFRGDATLLAPGPEQLTERTGMACAGVVPMLHHELPDEEGATVRADPGPGALDVAVVRFPFGANLDELHVLARAASVRFVDHPAELAGADLVVLPGSKHVTADLAWLRDRGLATAIERLAAGGVRVLGICGGCQVLGRVIDDPDGVEGGRPGVVAGLALLPFTTVFGGEKVTTRRQVTMPADLPASWAALRGVTATGYEIRMGRTAGGPVWADGNVLATTVHGLLEDPDVVERLVGRRPTLVLEDTFDLLADAVDEHLDTDLLRRLTTGRAGSRMRD
ncbi:MAG: cobyric acid synthase [Ilumatobacteraceae bacterium]